MIPPTVGTGPQAFTDFLSQAPEQLRNERRALLALMAERGTEGQLEYERNKRAAEAARAASIEMAAARGAQISAPGTLAAELAQDYNRVMANQLAMSDAGMLAHGREMDRISAANAAYFDQLGGAADLARQMLAAQLAAQAAGGGGGGRRGGRGGGGGGGGGAEGSFVPTAQEPDTVPAGMLIPHGSVWHQPPSTTAPVMYGPPKPAAPVMYGPPRPDPRPGATTRAASLLSAVARGNPSTRKRTRRAPGTSTVRAQ